MNQERYWRNLIADEIRAEHDRVQSYYRKKGANSGGMSNEEHTRLNIFRLCESVARSMKESPDAPKEDSRPIPTPGVTLKSTGSIAPEPTPEPVVSSSSVEPVELGEDIEIEPDLTPHNSTTVQEEIEELNSFIEEQIQEVWQEEEKKEDLIRNLVKDTPRQNQFGEFL